MSKDRDADYAAAGFGGSLGWGRRPALLLVDIVMAYFEKSSPLYAGVESILPANAALRAAARAAGIPVIFTGVRYAPGGVDGGLFYRKVTALRCFDAGNPLGAFPPELQPAADELVVIKHYASAFFGTSLASTLRALGCDCVLVTGLSTSGCVRASALDALQSGFIPIVVRECVGDRDAHVQESNLFDLQAKYADVVSLQQVFDYLANLKN
jgi:maleamate amidohydrolase